MTFWPFLLVSLLTGYLALQSVLRDRNPFAGALHFLLSAVTGLGISASLAFYATLCQGTYSMTTVLILHGLLWMTLLLIVYIKERNWDALLAPLQILKFSDAIILGITGLFILVSHSYTITQPYGGWDAWSVWNFKAKFIFLEQENWRALLDPLLWRSSQHYPLLLPFMNVWLLGPAGEFLEAVPRWISVLMTAMTAGILMAGLKTWIKPLPSVTAALLVFCLPFFQTLGTSQYSDIVVGAYLLCGFICLLRGLELHHGGLMGLSGLLAGFMSFAKNEGLAMAAILASLLAVYTFVTCRDKSLLAWFGGGLLIGGLATLIFQVAVAPPNQTFINGLVSADHPITLRRVKITLGYLFFELISDKWNGLWVLIVLALLLLRRRSWSGATVILPAFFVLYTFVVVGYYLLNTYFEILWWLNATISRLLFTVLPAVVFWVFLCAWRKEEE